MKVACIEYTDKKPFHIRLKEALEGTGIPLEDFADVTAKIFSEISFRGLENPILATQIVGQFIQLIFELGIKYAVENPNAAKITYEEE